MYSYLCTKQLEIILPQAYFTVAEERHLIYITYSFSHADISYFKLVDTGTTLHIQAHNDSNVKVCVHNDTLLTGASGVTEMHTSGPGTTGVKIYFDEADGDRWYLRVYLNSADEEVVELVSQSYIDNVSTDNLSTHAHNVVDYRICIIILYTQI